MSFETINQVLSITVWQKLLFLRFEQIYNLLKIYNHRVSPSGGKWEGSPTTQKIGFSPHIPTYLFTSIWWKMVHKNLINEVCLVSTSLIPFRLPDSQIDSQPVSICKLFVQILQDYLYLLLQNKPQEIKIRWAWRSH